MPATKTATLNLRIDPDLKKALKKAAEKEHRSIANLIEILVREHCRQAKIPLSERTERLEDSIRS